MDVQGDLRRRCMEPRRRHGRVAAVRLLQGSGVRWDTRPGDDARSVAAGELASLAAVPAGWAALRLRRAKRTPRPELGLCRLPRRPPAGAADGDQRAGALLASGYLLYVQDGALLARAFDASTLTFAGDPMPIADGMGAQGIGLRARFSLSDTGVLVHQAPGRASLPLRWYDRTGRALGRSASLTRINNFRISPDGTPCRRRSSTTTLAAAGACGLSMSRAEPGRA